MAQNLLAKGMNHSPIRCPLPVPLSPPCSRAARPHGKSGRLQGRRAQRLRGMRQSVPANTAPSTAGQPRAGPRPLGKDVADATGTTVVQRFPRYCATTVRTLGSLAHPAPDKKHAMVSMHSVASILHAQGETALTPRRPAYHSETTLAAGAGTITWRIRVARAADIEAIGVGAVSHGMEADTSAPATRR